MKWALLFLLLGGCSSVKGYVVSGETLDLAGSQFLAAAPVFASACEGQKLPIETCRGWRDFATRFQTLYRPSVDAWWAAAKLNDAALERRYSDMAGPLIAELTKFYAALKTANLLPAGAP